MKIRDKHIGFIFGTGLRAPMVSIQFTPLYWQLSFATHRNKLAFGLGPLAVSICFIPKTYESCLKIWNEHLR